MTTLETNLIGIITRTKNVKSFRLAPQHDLTFQAGQFMGISLNIDGKEQTKYLSFSSSPTETSHWEFTKRITSSEFSQTLDQLKIHDRLNVRMPMGRFILDEHKKIAFLSGGIGITPIRSMLKNIIDLELPYDVITIYGNRSPHDIVFKEDMDLFCSNDPTKRIIYTIDKPPETPGSWEGEIGLIDAAMIQNQIPDFSQRKFYICGPPAMVTNLTNILTNDLKISPAYITKENFTGY